jgi:hypothetical protein
LVDAIPPLRGERGRPRQRPDCVLGDRGYDAAAIRRGLRARHIVPWLAMRRTRHGHPGETDRRTQPGHMPAQVLQPARNPAAVYQRDMICWARLDSDSFILDVSTSLTASEAEMSHCTIDDQ